MKSRTFILTAIVMCLLTASIDAEVSLSFEENDLIAHSDQKGVEGFKGCDAAKLKKIAAYTFRLLKKGTPANNARCSMPTGKWKQVDEKTSNNGSVLFENVPEGEYKVICLAGKAIGCMINGVPEGYPERSIVYEQEMSESTGSKRQKKLDTNALTSINAELLIFPNPAQSEINIQLKHPKMKNEVLMVIYDLRGKELYNQNYTINQDAGDRWKVKTQGYASGTYLLRIFDSEGVSLEGKFQVVQD